MHFVKVWLLSHCSSTCTIQLSHFVGSDCKNWTAFNVKCLSNHGTLKYIIAFHQNVSECLLEWKFSWFNVCGIYSTFFLVIGKAPTMGEANVRIGHPKWIRRVWIHLPTGTFGPSCDFPSVSWCFMLSNLQPSNAKYITPLRTDALSPSSPQGSNRLSQERPAWANWSSLHVCSADAVMKINKTLLHLGEPSRNFKLAKKFAEIQVSWTDWSLKPFSAPHFQNGLGPHRCNLFELLFFYPWVCCTYLFTYPSDVFD